MVDLDKVQNYIWIFALIGIIAGVAVLINTEFLTTLPDSSVKFTVSNESLTIVDAETLAILTNSNDPFGNYSGVSVTNATAGEYITVGNYSITSRGIIMQSGEYNATVNVTYIFERYTTQGNILQNSTLGIANITKQLPTVGTVIGVSLIVAVVVTLFFFFRGKRQTF